MLTWPRRSVGNASKRSQNKVALRAALWQSTLVSCASGGLAVERYRRGEQGTQTPGEAVHCSRDVRRVCGYCRVVCTAAARYPLHPTVRPDPCQRTRVEPGASEARRSREKLRTE